MSKENRKMLISPEQASARLDAGLRRLDQIMAAAAIPEACGPDIRPAPARGGFVLVQNVELLPVGTDKVEAVHRGYGGRSAIRRADAFDAMIAASLRRREPLPLTLDQIAVGRRYHDLVELLSRDGVKLSNLQASGGGGDGTSWIDQRLQLSGELEALQRRIGTGAALAVRRVRPSDRGLPAARWISDRALVDAVCLQGMGIRAVLLAHGWSDRGGHKKTLGEALSEALDRMMGCRHQKRC